MTVAIGPTPIAVQPGQVLTGLITQTAQGNGLYTATCSFSNVPNTALTISNEAVYTQAVMTLEVYYTKQVNDYPQALFTDFNNIYIAAPLMGRRRILVAMAGRCAVRRHIDVFSQLRERRQRGAVLPQRNQPGDGGFRWRWPQRCRHLPPQHGTWYVDLSTGGSLGCSSTGPPTSTCRSRVIGLGNGTSQVAVYRPNTATWYAPSTRVGWRMAGATWTAGSRALSKWCGHPVRSLPPAQCHLVHAEHAQWGGIRLGWRRDVPILAITPAVARRRSACSGPSATSGSRPPRPVGSITAGPTSMSRSLRTTWDSGICRLASSVHPPVSGSCRLASSPLAPPRTSPCRPTISGRARPRSRSIARRPGSFFIVGGPIYNCPGRWSSPRTCR